MRVVGSAGESCEVSGGESCAVSRWDYEHCGVSRQEL